MRWRFFTVSALAPETGEQALNAFSAGHRIVSVDKHFVAQGPESFWAFCVTYADGAELMAGSSSARRERIDYKELLGERDFAVYAELRSLRKRMAEREGVPAYALFTNEQLAEMVTRRVDSPAALGAIDGIGRSRLEKYGAAFLNQLQSALAASAASKNETAADRSD